MKNAALNWVRLPLNSVENCRDLGGYPTEAGEQTKWHPFLRSSNLSQLTAEDTAFLQEYGLKTVIDLRTENEATVYPNPLADEDFCEYHSIPFITEQISNITLSSYKDVTIGSFYTDLLEQNQAR